MSNRAEVNGPLAPSDNAHRTVNATAASVIDPSTSVTADSDNAVRRVRGRPFEPGNRYGKGRPRKGESIPEKLKRKIEAPASSDAIVDAVYARLLREDAVGNRAFADVRDTVYGIPKQTLVLEQGESVADALDQRLAARRTIDIPTNDYTIEAIDTAT